MFRATRSACYGTQQVKAWLESAMGMKHEAKASRYRTTAHLTRQHLVVAWSPCGINTVLGLSINCVDLTKRRNIRICEVVEPRY